MRADAASIDPRPDVRPVPLPIFQLRCWARATLWATCMLSLADAVDALQQYAEASGLIDELGQDEVQALISREFEAAASV